MQHERADTQVAYYLCVATNLARVGLAVWGDYIMMKGLVNRYNSGDTIARP